MRDSLWFAFFALLPAVVFTGLIYTLWPLVFWLGAAVALIIALRKDAPPRYYRR